jgi:hypothetical protein
VLFEGAPCLFYLTEQVKWTQCRLKNYFSKKLLDLNDLAELKRMVPVEWIDGHESPKAYHLVYWVANKKYSWEFAKMIVLLCRNFYFEIIWKDYFLGSGPGVRFGTDLALVKNGKKRRHIFYLHVVREKHALTPFLFTCLNPSLNR